jgi:poly(A) polymerase
MMRKAFELMKIMNDAGRETRIAGGAVRDTVMRQNPKDIDLATVAKPEEVREIFTKLGHSVIDTGLQHGTVTVVIDHIPYEVTTLRVDSNQDGRHADVTFTDSFEEDAKRRDFTMNAMYMDYNGDIHDFHEGKRHINQQMIYFVGDPEQRIKEDYLRILRYFRFMARFRFGHDYNAMYAMGDLRMGLHKISHERIYSEIMKTAQVNDTQVFYLMNNSCISEVVFNKNLKTEETTHTKPEITLFMKGIGSNWFREFKAPADVIKTIEWHEKFQPSNFNFDLFKNGAERMREWCFINNVPWGSKFAEAPKFPLTGHDFPHLKGKAIGDKLKELQKVWAENNFEPTKQELLKENG